MKEGYLIAVTDGGDVLPVREVLAFARACYGLDNRLWTAPTSPPPRRAYPSDVTDDEWLFCRNDLELMREDAPQRDYSSRELFNAAR